MQIGKSPYNFCVHIKTPPWKFRFLILGILELLAREVCKFLNIYSFMLIFNIFYINFFKYIILKTSLWWAPLHNGQFLWRRRCPLHAGFFVIKISKLKLDRI